MVFNKDQSVYTARTHKGSTVVIYQGLLGWDWFINDGSELPTLNTPQQRARANSPILTGSYMTPEEAIDNFADVVNETFSITLEWIIE